MSENLAKQTILKLKEGKIGIKVRTLMKAIIEAEKINSKM